MTENVTSDWPQQWLFRIPCHVTYQMKGIDFSIRPLNILDQLEVIWPHHDQKCDLRLPPWPQQWLFHNPCHVTYQIKVNYFSIRPFNVLDQLEVNCLTMTKNVTSDDLHDHNNDVCLSHVMWHIKRKVITSVFDLSIF